MATAKGRKIGRCKKSPSHKAYNAVRRDWLNRVRNTERHCKAFPNDMENADRLFNVRSAGPWPVSFAK